MQEADFLGETAHRPWPLSQGPWAVAMSWHGLLFAHWPLSPDILSPLLPAGLTPDVFDGRAWIAVVPFRMTGVRPRPFPAVRCLSDFLELNVRTYVTVQDRPGVYFFSLDAANPVAVTIARRWYGLPYFNARMSLEETAGEFSYQSKRRHWKAPPAHFRARYRPVGPPETLVKGSLEHWLIERYCLYSVSKTGRIYRGEIHHRPWPIQRAEADIELNTMTEAIGVSLPAQRPILHFARRLDVVAWAPEQAAYETPLLHV